MHVPETWSNPTADFLLVGVHHAILCAWRDLSCLRAEQARIKGAQAFAILANNLEPTDRPQSGATFFCDAIVAPPS
jgi:hypothetical protein